MNKKIFYPVTGAKTGSLCARVGKSFISKPEKEKLQCQLEEESNGNLNLKGHQALPYTIGLKFISSPAEIRIFTKSILTDNQLNTQISSLPTDLKKEVSDFVKFLKHKSKAKKKVKERQFGCAKGFFKMAPDFDEPLNDFKEFM